jgi:hypothetical protein
MVDASPLAEGLDGFSADKFIYLLAKESAGILVKFDAKISYRLAHHDDFDLAGFEYSQN